MRKIARHTYSVIVSLFLVGILTQVYFVGLTMLAGQPSMAEHAGLGLLLGPVTLLIIILAYVAGLPRSMKIFSWLTFINYTVMVMITGLRQSVPVVAAFHPVLALALFFTMVTLVVRSWRAAREPLNKPQQSAAQPEVVGARETAAH